MTLDEESGEVGLRGRRRRQAEGLDEDAEEGRRDESRQARTDPGVLDPQMKERQQDRDRFPLVPGMNERWRSAECFDRL